MKIVFMGTPGFAVPSLEALCDNGYVPAAIVTQPDRACGRGKKLTMPLAKACAIKRGVPVYQFESISSAEGIACLKEIAPDLLITVAFGQILSREVLEIPPLGCVNVHASLLPAYRGASPIQHAILNGDKVTGITTMYTDAGLDTGDIILKRETEIQPEETAGELSARLAVLGAETLIETLKLIEEGKAPRTPQDHSWATKCSVIKKEMGDIRWDKSAEDIRNLVRALDPCPGAYTSYCGQRIKIWKVAVTDRDKGGSVPGEIVEASARGGLFVCSGDKVLEIIELQAVGGKRMSAKEYLRAHCMDPGQVFTQEVR